MIQPGSLERAHKGGAITAKIFNGPVDLLNRMHGAGPAQQVMPHPMPAASEEKAQGRIRALRLGGMSSSGFMQCTDYESGALVNVGMPLEFRRDLWHGTTRQHAVLGVGVRYTYGPTAQFPDFSEARITRRVATIINPDDPLGNRDFIEQIIPDYRWVNPTSVEQSGEWDGHPVIMAINSGPDGTGLTAPIDRGEGPVDELVIWHDLNWAARAWMMVPTELLP
jgi:hypothetical protein